MFDQFRMLVEGRLRATGDPMGHMPLPKGPMPKGIRAARAPGASRAEAL
ncbi:hypothetical protein ACFQ61_29110 [Streptomyces sp. NPDC056500]